MSVSRRGLFGLLAGAAAAPLLKAAAPDLWLRGVPVYYGRSEIAMLTLVNSRINEAMEQARVNLSKRLYGPSPGADGLRKLFTGEDD